MNDSLDRQRPSQPPATAPTIAIDDIAQCRQLLTWLGSGSEPTELTFHGPRQVLPSVYDVTGFATASIGAAGATIADYWSARMGQEPRPVRVDRRHAALAFQSERHLQGVDAPIPEVWDDLSGDYETAGGFVRLHTIYRHHRERALSALGLPGRRQGVVDGLRRRKAMEVEQAVVEGGGCAAAMRTPQEWAEHEHGAHLVGIPLWGREEAGTADGPRPLEAANAERPLAGLRVLDLTRVIAGPVCTRFLAAHGADVLRIDPPGFEEVPALLREVTAGKRRAHLDLRAGEGRARFEALVAQADVLVHGYRPGALARLGYDDLALRSLRPGLVVGQVSAYGNDGPFGGRRGFDSLVQMSCGIAERGMQVNGAERPVPLPAQALDHGSGYLLAAALVGALARRWRGEPAATVSVSLARTATHLMSLGEVGDVELPPPTAAEIAPYLTSADSAFGRLRQVQVPAPVEGTVATFANPAGPLGSHRASW